MKTKEYPGKPDPEEVNNAWYGTLGATKETEEAAKKKGIEIEEYENKHGCRKVILPSDSRFGEAFQKTAPWDLGQTEIKTRKDPGELEGIKD